MSDIAHVLDYFDDPEKSVRTHVTSFHISDQLKNLEDSDAVWRYQHAVIHGLGEEWVQELVKRAGLGWHSLREKRVRLCQHNKGA